jgi:hypothetical protein
MAATGRWEPCIYHRAADATEFVADYFTDESRKVLLIAGGGFDPRATFAAELLAGSAGSRLRGIFIREERPSPSLQLVSRADKNIERLMKLVPQADVQSIQVLAEDYAVIGGRQLSRILQQINFKNFTDVVVDLSALSIGISFPTVRILYQWVETGELEANIHLLVADQPMVDSGIRPIPTDRTGPVFGFGGRLKLDSEVTAKKLWMPQLIVGKKSILEKIRQAVGPDDICPVLPFPCHDPRLPDALIEHYADEFGSTWEIDARNVVYAEERNPLDLYATIRRIDDFRERVFAEVGGSLTVLSPLGSKASAIGAQCHTTHLGYRFPGCVGDVVGDFNVTSACAAASRTSTAWSRASDFSAGTARCSFK